MSWLDAYFVASAKGVEFGGTPVGDMTTALQGYVAAWDNTAAAWIPKCGVTCVAQGQCIANGDTPVVVSTASVEAIAPGDMVLFGVSTAVAQGAVPVVTAIAAGASFTFVADANDLSIYNYAVLRLGAAR